MRLSGFSVYRYRLPLVRPLQLKGVTLQCREGLLVRLVSDAGAEGWGEAAPLPGFSQEPLVAAAGQLLDLKAQLPGQDLPPGWRAGIKALALDGRQLYASVRFGLELALAGLYAAARGGTLPEVLFPEPRPLVALSGLLTGSGEEVLQQALRLRAAGYTSLKLKVGRGSLDEEIHLVCRLAEALQGAVRLRLDANRAWRLEEAVRFAQATAGCAVDYIEEPLADPEALPVLARTYGVPVALDESLVGLPAEALDRHRYAKAVVLKPTLLGGLVPTLRLAEKAAEVGMTPVLSASFESGVGLRGLIALAAGMGPEETAAGLDTYWWLEQDVLRPPLALQGGRVDVAALMRTERALNRHFLTAV